MEEQNDPAAWIQIVWISKKKYVSKVFGLGVNGI